MRDARRDRRRLYFNPELRGMAMEDRDIFEREFRLPPPQLLSPQRKKVRQAIEETPQKLPEGQAYLMIVD